MKPPPVQFVDVPRRRQGSGCGCSMGCLGMGCLLMAAGFFGLLFLAYYATLHTSLPLKLIERAIEQDGKLQIDGLSGNFANGIRFEKFRFWGDGKRWSELRDVVLRYQGLVGVNLSGDIDIREVHIGGGTLYLDDARPNQFNFSLPGFDLDKVLDSDQRMALRTAGSWNIESVDIGKLEIINPRSSFRFTIDHARISGVRFLHGQLQDLGTWSIESDPLEVKTDASRRWPDSPTARRLMATFRKGFFPNLKVDFGATLEVEGGETPLQYHGECADGKVRIDDNGRRMMIEYDDYTPSNFFQGGSELPLQHVTFRAVRNRNSESLAPIHLESGGHFQVGETVFQMNETSLDPEWTLLRGGAQLGERVVRIELDSNSALFHALSPKLWVDEQPATPAEWAEIVYGRPENELTSLEKATLERAAQQAAAAERGVTEPEAETPPPPVVESTLPAEAEPLPPAPPPTAPGKPRDEGATDEGATEAAPSPDKDGALEVVVPTRKPRNAC